MEMGHPAHFGLASRLSMAPSHCAPQGINAAHKKKTLKNAASVKGFISDLRIGLSANTITNTKKAKSSGYAMSALSNMNLKLPTARAAGPG